MKKRLSCKVHGGLLLLALLLASGWAHGQVIIIGGQGASWESGGGDIPATVIRTATKVEQTNAPGGVIDFAVEGLDNWIFPQRADTTVNIAVGANNDERGGGINSPNTLSIRGVLPNIIDNDGESALDLRASSGGGNTPVLGIIIDLDLGARFGIDRFKFFPRNADPDFPAPTFPFQNEFIRGFEIFVNDGTPENQLEGVPILQTVAVDGQNEDAVVDLRIPPQYVRFVRLKSITAAGFEIAEFQVFGTGFVPEASYVSNVYDFGDLGLLGNLRWVQGASGDANLSSVEIRTRTGDDPQPVEFNRVRPGERIFRSGGGAQSGNRSGTSTANVEVPWKGADEVEDSQLQQLVIDVLDNETVDVREALTVFKDLSLDERLQLSLEEDEYDDLRNEDKGTIRDDVTNWSGWSPPYPEGAIVGQELLDDPTAGVRVTSPGPSRYFQFGIEFFSNDFNSAKGIGGLAFEVISPPFAEELIAEIVPRGAELGVNTRFTYAVLNKGRPGRERGFDRFRIDTPLRVEEVGKVEIRRPDGGVEEADFSGQSLDAVPLTVNDFTIAQVEDNSFTLEFPIIEEDGALLKVEFDNGVLRFGTTFSGRAFNSQASATIGQEVMAGNAADLGEGGVVDTDIQPLGTPLTDNLSVAVPIVKDLLVNVASQPPVFTPNGDGFNDRAFIQYDITNIARPSGVEVLVFDLAGRMVRRLFDDRDISGRFARPWDGRDDSGNLVPPGNYLVSVSLQAGTGEEREVTVASVAY